MDRPTTIRHATGDDHPAILGLLAESLGWENDGHAAARFAWKHLDNPFGPSIMLVAEADGCIVGFRALMRWQFRCDGRIVRAVRAVDTATAIAARGRGVFTALTRDALAVAAEDGVEWVFNTPNSASRPGYLQMGWVDVGRLPVSVIVGGPRRAVKMVTARTAAQRASAMIEHGRTVADWLDSGGRPEQFAGRATPTSITTAHDATSLRWRYGDPSYRVLGADDEVAVFRVRRRGAATEMTVVESTETMPRKALVACRSAVGADYAIRLGHRQRGWLPLPRQGPMLTWRHIADEPMPTLDRWNLHLGDIELF